MARKTFLGIVNNVLNKLNKSNAQAISGSTGLAGIVINLVNEVQQEIYMEDDWYTLLESSTFNTAAGTATYAMPSDIGRTIILFDETNNNVLVEESVRNIDTADPDADYQGPPLRFSTLAAFYKLYPIPDGTYTLRYRYYKVPPDLGGDNDTSALPIECERALITKVYAEALMYLNSFEKAAAFRQEYERMLAIAKKSNRKVVDRMDVFRGDHRSRFPIGPAQFPQGYPRTRW